MKYTKCKIFKSEVIGLGSYNHECIFFFLICTGGGGGGSVQMEIMQKRPFTERILSTTVGQWALFFRICKTIGVRVVMFWEQNTKDILLQAPEDGDRVSGSLKIRNNLREETLLCLSTPPPPICT